MDTNLTYRDGGSAGNLTATGNATKAYTPATSPAYVILTIPAVTGTTPTLDLKAEFLNGSSAVLQTVTIPQITTAAGVYNIPVFCDKPTVASLKVTWTITGTTPNYGAADVYLSLSPVS